MGALLVLTAAVSVIGTVIIPRKTGSTLLLVQLALWLGAGRGRG